MKISSLLKVLLSTALIACKSPVVDPPVGTSPVVNPPVGATARKLVWSDEFTEPGLPNAAKWTYEVGGNGWGNKELQYYTDRRAENARVENGKLIIEARKEEYVGKQYTSARLITNGKQAWQYGRIEVVAKLPAGRGTFILKKHRGATVLFQDERTPALYRCENRVFPAYQKAAASQI